MGRLRRGRRRLRLLRLLPGKRKSLKWAMYASSFGEVVRQDGAWVCRGVKTYDLLSGYSTLLYNRRLCFYHYISLATQLLRIENPDVHQLLLKRFCLQVSETPLSIKPPSDAKSVPRPVDDLTSAISTVVANNPQKAAGISYFSTFLKFPFQSLIHRATSGSSSKPPSQMSGVWNGGCIHVDPRGPGIPSYSTVVDRVHFHTQKLEPHFNGVMSIKSLCGPTSYFLKTMSNDVNFRRWMADRDKGIASDARRQCLLTFYRLMLLTTQRIAWLNHNSSIQKQLSPLPQAPPLANYQVLRSPASGIRYRLPLNIWLLEYRMDRLSTIHGTLKGVQDSVTRVRSVGGNRGSILRNWLNILGKPAGQETATKSQQPSLSLPLVLGSPAKSLEAFRVNAGDAPQQAVSEDFSDWFGTSSNEPSQLLCPLEAKKRLISSWNALCSDRVAQTFSTILWPEHQKNKADEVTESLRTQRLKNSLLGLIALYNQTATSIKDYQLSTALQRGLDVPPALRVFRSDGTLCWTPLSCLQWCKTIAVTTTHLSLATSIALFFACEEAKIASVLGTALPTDYVQLLLTARNQALGAVQQYTSGGKEQDSEASWQNPVVKAASHIGSTMSTYSKLVLPDPEVFDSTGVLQSLGVV